MTFVVTEAFDLQDGKRSISGSQVVLVVAIHFKLYCCWHLSQKDTIDFDLFSLILLVKLCPRRHFQSTLFISRTNNNSYKAAI